MKIVTVLKDNVVQEIFSFDTTEAQEEAFGEICADYGVEAVDADYDNGYLELECGTTVCICTAQDYAEA